MRTYLSRFPGLLDAIGFPFVAGYRQLQLRRFVRQRKRDEAAGVHGLDVGDIARPLPRIIWTYWGQGLAEAPELIRFCVYSWQRHNPGWTIHVLDQANEHRFVDMTDVPPDLSFTKRSDILRLRLLQAHGGVWVDATVYCHRPLEHWLPMMMTAGFFMFHRAGPDRLIASWFIAAEVGNATIARWNDYVATYWSGSRSDGFFYFALHYLLNWAMIRHRDISRAFAAMPKIPATPALFAQRVGAYPALRPFAREALARGLPVSKLNRKRAFDRLDLERLFEEGAG